MKYALSIVIESQSFLGVFRRRQCPPGIVESQECIVKRANAVASTWFSELLCFDLQAIADWFRAFPAGFQTQLFLDPDSRRR